MGPKYLAVFCGCKSIIMRLYLQNFGHYYAVLIRRGVGGGIKTGRCGMIFLLNLPFGPLGAELCRLTGVVNTKLVLGQLL